MGTLTSTLRQAAGEVDPGRAAAQTGQSLAGATERIERAEGDRSSSEGNGADRPSGTDVWTNTAQALPERALEHITAGPLRAGLNTAATVLEQGIQGAAPDEVWDSFKVQAEALLGGETSEAPHPDGVLGSVAAGMEWLIGVEQMLSLPLAMIPWPAFPALRVTDMDIGLPHAHSHPPNLVPPATVPVALPSTGPVIPIPFLSGATSTLINGLPAARCEDWGLAVWCGSYFPMYEVVTGSSSVWIEGQRAARMGTDLTQHCIFSKKPPKDPPIGPFTGVTISGSPQVLIGGIPMPSLLSLALGAAIKRMFQGLGKVVKRLRALRKGADDVVEEASGFSRFGARTTDDAVTDQMQLVSGPGRPIPIQTLREAWELVDRVLQNRNIVISGGPDFRGGVIRDLTLIATTDVGRTVLDDIAKSGKRVEIDSLAGHNALLPPGARPAGPRCIYQSDDAFNGNGTNSLIQYEPGVNGGPESPSDVVLLHELDHAQRAAYGDNLQNQPYPPGTQEAYYWQDPEEVKAVRTENLYRAERGGVRQRLNYRDAP